MESTLQKELEGLGDKMADDGLITMDQLDLARKDCRETGENLGHVLVKKGFLTEFQIISFLSKSLSIPCFSTQDTSPEPDLIKLVPAHLARRYRLIPLQKRGNRILVAMADPLDKTALDKIQPFLPLKGKPVLTSEEEIDDLIRLHYDHQKVERASSRTVDKSEVTRLVDEIILQAWREGASDIHLAPDRDALQVSYRIQGLLRHHKKISRMFYHPVLSHIKDLAGPEKTGQVIGISPEKAMFKIATFPSLYGEKLIIRFLEES